METQKVNVLPLIAGTAVGAGSGLAIGAKKAKSILAPYTEIIKDNTVDKYVSDRVNANFDNVISTYKPKQARKAIEKVMQKAKADFESLSAKLPDAKKLAKNTKIKWIAGLTAAGVAVGAIYCNRNCKQSKS